MQCELPSNIDAEAFRGFFDDIRTIAVAGLSPDINKASNAVARYLQTQGFTILPIYPKEEIILGEKVYRSLSEITQRVDLAVMFRKAAAADDLAREILARNDVKAMWLQEGIINDGAISKIRKSGRKAVQNLCVMKVHTMIKQWAKQ